MGIVRLGANGEVEIIEPCTAEEAARADAAVIAIAEALGRLAAQRDYDEAVNALDHRKNRPGPTNDPAD